MFSFFLLLLLLSLSQIETVYGYISHDKLCAITGFIPFTYNGGNSYDHHDVNGNGNDDGLLLLENDDDDESDDESNSETKSSSVDDDTDDDDNDDSYFWMNEYSKIAFNMMASTILGMEVFNNRDASVIPQLNISNNNIIKKCTIKFDMNNTKFYDSSIKSHVSGISFIDYIINNHNNNGNNKPPCAIVGPTNDIPARDLSVMAHSYNIPLVAAGGYDIRIIDELYSPWSNNVYPSLRTESYALIKYLLSIGRNNYIGFLYGITDISLQRHALLTLVLDEYNIKHKSYPYINKKANTAFDLLERNIKYEIQRIKNDSYRTIIIALEYALDDLPIISKWLEYYDMLNGNNNNEYFYIFVGDWFPQYIYNPTNPKYDNITKLLTGAAYITPSQNQYIVNNPFIDDPFTTAWKKYGSKSSKNNNFVDTVNNYNPISEGNEGYFYAPYDYFTNLSSYHSIGVGYMFDAIISIGIGSCIAEYNTNMNMNNNNNVNNNDKMESMQEQQQRNDTSSNSSSNGVTNSSNSNDTSTNSTSTNSSVSITNPDNPTFVIDNDNNNVNDNEIYISSKDHLYGIRNVDFTGATNRVKIGNKYGWNSRNETTAEYIILNLLPPPLLLVNDEGNDETIMMPSHQPTTTTAQPTILPSIMPTLEEPIDESSTSCCFVNYNNSNKMTRIPFVTTNIYQNQKWSVAINNNNNNVTFIYSNGETTPPKLLRNEPNHNYLPNGLRILGFILMGIIIIGCLISCIWIYVNRNHKVLKASQPTFLYALCVGSFITSISIITLSYDESYGMLEDQLSILCMTTPWTSCIGLIVIYGALFGKLWRINKVLQPYRRIRNKIHTYQVIWPFIILLSLTILILILWTILDPLYWERIVINDNTGESIGSCTCNIWSAFITPLILVLLCSMSLTGYMAFTTKDVDESYSESKWIGVLFLLQFQVVILSAPVVTILHDTSTEARYLGTLLIVVAFPISTLCLIILPKVFSWRNNNSNNHNQQKTKKRGARHCSTGTGNVIVTGLHEQQQQEEQEQKQEQPRDGRCTTTTTTTESDNDNTYKPTTTTTTTTLSCSSTSDPH